MSSSPWRLFPRIFSVSRASISAVNGLAAAADRAPSVFAASEVRSKSYFRPEEGVAAVRIPMAAPNARNRLGYLPVRCGQSSTNRQFRSPCSGPALQRDRHRAGNTAAIGIPALHGVVLSQINGGASVSPSLSGHRKENVCTGDSLPTCNTLMTPRGGTLGVAELAAEGSQRGGPGGS
jgi:hypothetical protein